MTELTLDKDKLKKMEYSEHSASWVSNWLVSKEIKSKFVLQNYAIDESGIIYNTKDNYSVNDYSQLKLTQLTAIDQEYYKNEANWKPKPVTPEEIKQEWQSNNEAYLSDIRQQKNNINNKRISKNFFEEQVRKLGLLKNNELFFGFITNEDGNTATYTHSENVRLTEKGELFVIAGNLMTSLSMMEKSVLLQMELGIEKSMNPTLMTEADKIKYAALEQEGQELGAIKNQIINVSTPLNITNVEVSVIGSIEFKNADLTVDVFNAYTKIEDKLSALNITFTNSEIKPTNIKDIFLTQDGEIIKATITWDDLFITKVGYLQRDQTTNYESVAVYMDLPNGIKLYKSGFNKWNDVTKTSTSPVVSKPALPAK